MTTPRVAIRVPHDPWLDWYFHRSASALGETSSHEAIINAASGGFGTRDPEARMTDRRLEAACAYRHLRACLGKLTSDNRRVIAAVYNARQPQDDERHIARVFASSFRVAMESEAAERGFRVACAAWEKPPKTVTAFLARACVGNRDAELAAVIDEVAGAIRAALIDWELTNPRAAGEWIKP